MGWTTLSISPNIFSRSRNGSRLSAPHSCENPGEYPDETEIERDRIWSRDFNDHSADGACRTGPGGNCNLVWHRDGPFGSGCPQCKGGHRESGYRSVDGLGVRTTEITLAEGARETKDIVLGQGLLPSSPQEHQNLPDAPSSNRSKPSLSDLGFPPAEIHGSAQEQAKLDQRTHMLKIHQRLGLITAGALVATVIMGSSVEESTSSSTRDLHAALGSATAGLYITTAYFAIRAPKISGTKTRGPIRWHKTLAWIHGPGMILTPVLGALAYGQTRRGQEVHGIASAHGPVAYVTAVAYGAAILSVSLKF